MYFEASYHINKLHVGQILNTSIGCSFPEFEKITSLKFNIQSSYYDNLLRDTWILWNKSFIKISAAQKIKEIGKNLPK